MKPQARYKWIEQYLREREKITKQVCHVDILHDDFVSAYIEACYADYKPVFFGAMKCSQLARDLVAMKEKCYLRRFRTGIEGMAGMGFPKWVWSYHLAEHRYLNDER